MLGDLLWFVELGHYLRAEVRKGLYWFGWGWRAPRRHLRSNGRAHNTSTLLYFTDWHVRLPASHCENAFVEFKWRISGDSKNSPVLFALWGGSLRVYPSQAQSDATMSVLPLQWSRHMVWERQTAARRGASHFSCCNLGSLPIESWNWARVHLARMPFLTQSCTVCSAIH